MLWSRSLHNWGITVSGTAYFCGYQVNQILANISLAWNPKLSVRAFTYPPWPYTYRFSGEPREGRYGWRLNCFGEPFCALNICIVPAGNALPYSRSERWLLLRVYWSQHRIPLEHSNQLECLCLFNIGPRGPVSGRDWVYPDTRSARAFTGMIYIPYSFLGATKNG